MLQRLTLWLRFKNSMIDLSAWKQTNDLDKFMWKPIQAHQAISKGKKKKSFWYLKLSLWISLHSLQQVKPTAPETQGNTAYPVEKDEGDALFKIWAHEPLKGLFMPLLAWIITPSSSIMCCGWYIGPHLLLHRFHLARSSKSPINKRSQAYNRIAA